MTRLQCLAILLYVVSVFASPRNLLPQIQKREAGSGGSSDSTDHSHDDSWVPSSGNGPSQYGGSWDHGLSSESAKSHHGGGGDDWGQSSTCAAFTVTETLVSTQAGPTSTVYVSKSGYTSVLPASTVYISGSGYTSFLPASTITLAGSAHTKVATVYDTLTQPAAPTTVYITQYRSGWNHTVTREETGVVTTTQREYSTIYNEETTTLTSVVTLPGKPYWENFFHRLAYNYI